MLEIKIIHNLQGNEHVHKKKCMQFKVIIHETMEILISLGHYIALFGKECVYFLCSHFYYKNEF